MKLQLRLYTKSIANFFYSKNLRILAVLIAISYLTAIFVREHIIKLVNMHIQFYCDVLPVSSSTRLYTSADWSTYITIILIAAIMTILTVIIYIFLLHML